MTHRFHSVAVRMIGATGMACALVAGPAAAQERRVAYVQVLDGQGQPVTDLAPGEFRVSEDRAPGRVVSARIGTDPMRVALLIDNGAAMRAGRAVHAMRNAVAGFIATLPPRHSVGLFTIGGGMRLVVDFTTDREELVEQARGLFTHRAGGIRFVDSFREILERHYDEDEMWPVFVALITDSGEARAVLNERRSRHLIDSLRARGAIVHVVQWSNARRARPELPIRAGDPDLRPPGEAWADRGRLTLAQQFTRGRGGSGAITTVALDLTAASGGRYVAVVAASGMVTAMTRLANDIGAHYDETSTRYVLAYERPDPPGQQVVIGTTRPEVALRLFPDRAMQR